jgi:hypothetical protein
MPVSYLLFGPVLFQDFELPASITWGGAHSLAIHRLPGGARIIDAMGRDDADITWSGIFSGEDASFRARALDLMRAEGSVWPLTWDSFFYSAIIARLDIDHRRPNWLPYRISCTILRDEAASLLMAPITLASSVAQDLAQATTLAPFALQGTSLASPVDLATAPGIAGQAAQQSTANAYFARAARNASLV